MTHNHNLVLAAHKLFQRMCLDSGFYPCGLFHHLRFTAKIRDVVAFFDNNLVTASSKRQFHRDPRRFGSMGKRICVDSDTDTDGHCHLISDIYGFDFFQNIKFLFF